MNYQHPATKITISTLQQAISDSKRTGVDECIPGDPIDELLSNLKDYTVATRNRHADFAEEMNAALEIAAGMSYAALRNAVETRANAFLTYTAAAEICKRSGKLGPKGMIWFG